MSLELWLRNGWLQQDEVSVAEIQQLLQTATQLRTDVVNWLKTAYAALVPPNT